LEIAKLIPRADSTAGDTRSRESGHRTPMPNGTTRHQQSLPCRPLAGSSLSLANAIRNQVSTAISVLMNTNSHGRMLASGFGRLARRPLRPMLALPQQTDRMASMAVSPLRKEQKADQESGLMARRAIRAGTHRGPTAGLAPGNVQGNLAILPQALAADFLRFCQLNPKPCPLIGTSAPGDPRVPELGEDLDIRTDLPRYRVWKNGELVAEPQDIREFWRDDLVSFVIGCSFSFEEALMAEGMELRHITRGCNVPMYRTSIATNAAGPFHGPMVVSMRPLTPRDAIRAVQITTRFPSVHGAPVHIGKPEMIGIKDIMKPDYGDAVEVRDNELPVFWACGVTPQSVIATVKPEFCITHYPGSMLVTDRRNTEFAIL
jgi:uncharacterized protein YcsI (UPF0317 family)